MLYGNHTFECYGEGPSVNPFLGGPAVVEIGYGVEFHDGTRTITCHFKFKVMHK